MQTAISPVFTASSPPRGTPRFFERGQKKNNEVSVGGSQHLAGGVVPHMVKALVPFVTS